MPESMKRFNATLRNFFKSLDCFLMKLRNIECIIYTAEVLLISTTITKIVAQKRCSDIFSIDSLTEEIQLN